MSSLGLILESVFLLVFCDYPTRFVVMILSIHSFRYFLGVGGTAANILSARCCFKMVTQATGSSDHTEEEVTGKKKKTQFLMLCAKYFISSFLTQCTNCLKRRVNGEKTICTLLNVLALTAW